MDGYAVQGQDVAGARREAPVRLRVEQADGARVGAGADDVALHKVNLLLQNEMYLNYSAITFPL